MFKVYLRNKSTNIDPGQRSSIPYPCNECTV